MTTLDNAKRAREIYDLFNEMNKCDGDWVSGRKDVSELVVSLLSRLVNGSCSEITFYEQFKLEHRTLQQAMFSLFLGLCNDISKWEECWIDGRNEAMWKTAKKIMETLGYSGLPMI